MIFYVIFCVLLSSLYAMLILVYARAWQHSNQRLSTTIAEQRFISVVIVTRNEGRRLSQCIDSIVHGTYPQELYEIIIVNDHSSDDSIAAVQLQFPDRVKILSLSELSGLKQENYKKQGQSYGISQAKGDWIVSTDGDCICPPQWLEKMNQHLTHNDIVTGPIQMAGGKDCLSQFQVLDIMGTMAGTHFGIQKQLWYSGNAANMGFSKALYQEYNQSQVTSYASGDDMFFIQWAASMDMAVGFLHDAGAIVRTEVESTFSALWSQRLRWASKTKGYQDKGLQLLMSAIWVYSFLTIINFCLGILINPYFLWLGVVMIIIKAISDFSLFLQLKSFFQLQIPLFRSIGLSVTHMVYIAIIGIWSQLQSEYRWKGRVEN